MPSPPKHPLTPEEIAKFNTEQGSHYIQTAPPAATHKVLFSIEVEAGGLSSLLQDPVILAGNVPSVQRKLTEYAAAPPPDIKSERLWFTLEQQANGKTLVTYWYRSAWPPASPVK